MKRLDRCRGGHGLSTGIKPRFQVRSMSVDIRRKRKIKPGYPLRKTFPLFQIPNLVLDLDAENAPRVRQYDEVDEELEAAKWSQNEKVDAVLGRIRTFSDEVSKAGQNMESTASVPNPWRISAQDILSVALLGTSQPSPSVGREQAAPAATTNQSSLLGEVLRRNGIPSRVLHDENKVIEFMLHRQRIAKTQIETPEDLSRVLGTCASIPEMRRLVFQTMRTQAGSAIVSRCDADIIRILGLSLKLQSSGEGVFDGLTFLHGLTNNLSSRKIDIGAPLCLLGLELSSRALQPAAIRKYLDIGSAANYFVWDAEHAENRAASRAISASLAALLETFQPPAPGHSTTGRPFRWGGSQTELFTILTGRNLATSVVQPSFRATLPPFATQARHFYLRLMAELGAVRALWHEGIASSRRGQSQQPLLPPPDLLAAAVLRYAEYTARAARDPPARGLGATGQLMEDLLLDLQTVARYGDRSAETSASQHPPGTPGRLALPDMQPTRALAVSFLDDVVEAFGQKSAAAAMESIGRLLEHEQVASWLRGAPEQAEP